MPVGGESLAVFRIAFGATMLWQATRYLSNGWLAANLVNPPTRFAYIGFEWIQPLGLGGTRIVVLVMALAAVLVALGWAFRVASATLWATFTYLFLIEESLYLNHYYAAALLAFLLIFIPADACWSVDAHRRGRSGAPVPRWSVLVLRFQVGVIYVFGGVAKLSSEWLSGRPMEIYASGRQHVPFVAWVSEMGLTTAVLGYGGLIFDLFVVPALLWRRTRVAAFAAAVSFHLINSQLFPIGIFPALMIAGTTLFLTPSWPRHLVGALTEQPLIAGAPRTATIGSLSPSTIALLATYAASQILVPLRHLAYPGDVNWTNEGHRFAWRMMLNAKSGQLVYKTVSGNDTTWIDPSNHLTAEQRIKIVSHPDMILQFAHELAYAQRQSNELPAVHAVAVVSLNGQARQLLVDSTVDLARQKRSLLPASWIVSRSRATRLALVAKSPNRPLKY